jgi:phage baseplate assembly protein gpV
MRRYPGVVIGIVKSLNDPDQEGRIEVEFPWLVEEERSGWAPIATLMAGGDRGAYFMPEIGDEVLVAFEHGEFDHPFVVGFLWNGAQRPPHSDINASVRRLRTVSGHRVEFDDNDGQERILIITAGGHQIEMKDTAPASITITTIGRQVIKLNDAPAEVSLKTAAGNEIKVSDSPPTITLSVPSGMVSVNCIQASLSSSAALKITAPLTVFTGTVQAPTVIAQSVVGSAYTPAPGNTFGL